MAEEQQSSLRSAIDKIMGWGGQPQGGQTPSQDQRPIQLTAPKSFSSDLGTTSAISNAVPAAAADPFAEQLAAIRTQNDALSAAPAAAAAPVVSSTWGSDLLALQKQYAAMPRVVRTLDESRRVHEMQNAIANMANNQPTGVTAPSAQEQMAALYPGRYNAATNSWNKS